MNISHLTVSARWSAWLLFVLWSWGPLAKGQNLASSNALVIKTIPQYVVVSGYWVEVEQQLRRHPQQSFTLTPQLYLGPLGQPDGPRYYVTTYWPQARGPRENERVRGFGLQAQHRLYLKASEKAPYPSGLYVSYGPNFQVFQIVYDRRQWQEVRKSDGLAYYEFAPKQHTATINRYGGTVQVGYQAPLLPGRVMLDLYAGVGLRESTSRDADAERFYRTGRSDYGHRGWYFPGGVKVGVALP